MEIYEIKSKFGKNCLTASTIPSNQCKIWTAFGIENVMPSLRNGIFFPGSRHCLSEYF